MKVSETDIVLVPGLGNSTGGHWQRRWLNKLPNAFWVEQKDWNNPNPDDWAQSVVETVKKTSRPVALVGHSLGTHTIARAAPLLKDMDLRGALLVATPDVAREGAPETIGQFAPYPRDPLPFPSIMISSDDDPYSSVDVASETAGAWGSAFHVMQEAGHINEEAGFGLWPDGMMMLGRLLKRF